MYGSVPALEKHDAPPPWPPNSNTQPQDLEARSSKEDEGDEDKEHVEEWKKKREGEVKVKPSSSPTCLAHFDKVPGWRRQSSMAATRGGSPYRAFCSFHQADEPVSPPFQSTHSPLSIPSGKIPGEDLGVNHQATTQNPGHRRLGPLSSISDAVLDDQQGTRLLGTTNEVTTCSSTVGQRNSWTTRHQDRNGRPHNPLNGKRFNANTLNDHGISIIKIGVTTISVDAAVSTISVIPTIDTTATCDSTTALIADDVEFSIAIVSTHTTVTSNINLDLSVATVDIVTIDTAATSMTTIGIVIPCTTSCFGIVI
ncbi:hypothetical protein E1B28_009430 [Marasmius oreades]|uniref:Uncharacterized protein n=1 Tax=Marasmius oreades TaxID=181124 RepID=A0A9P7S0L7_9AGAR|nr:uncharacterized protein E1B28_009430 [Marasmius oreades]KAG7093147.1 hypothetical protein E1B28_009430 [Marasmius oreades]